MRKVLLSTPLILEVGTFQVRELSLDEARAWAEDGDVENFCGHQTTKVLGIEPTQDRRVCEAYDQALALKPQGRLEFGREYTTDEVLAIGVTCVLIEKVSGQE